MGLKIGAPLAVSFFLAVGGWAEPADAAPIERPIQLDAKTKRVFIGRNLEYFVDPSGKLTVENIARGGDRIKFKRNRVGQPNFGITSSTIWLRFRIDIAEEGRRERIAWLLECTRTFISYITLYTQTPNGDFTAQEAGFASTRPRGDLTHRNFLFRLESDRASSVYYIKVRSTTPISLPFSVWSRSHFNLQDGWRSYGFGMFFGVIVVMVFYNLFLFISIRDRAYLYYVLYIAGYAVFLLGASGYLRSFDVLPELIMRYITQWFSFFATLFALKFSSNYLLLEKHTPRLYGLTRITMIGTGAMLVLMFPLPQIFILYAVNIIPMFAIVLMIAAGIVCLRQGYRPARYFLLAWGLLVLGLMMYILANLNLIPGSYISEYSQFLGAALETVLLSLGLGNRINTLKAESEKAQQEKLTQERIARETQQKMAESFSRFVPRQFLNYLGKESVSDITHGDAVSKEMTVLFTDIRGFTSLSEQRTSEEIFHFLNVYLARMEPIIQKHGGFIDKFIGDAIMALFPGPSSAAIRAAVEMIEKAEELNRTGEDPIWRSLKMGMGLHRGELMLGTVGSPDRLDTTVVGDTVNLASRLEGATKFYQTPILMSDAVYKEAQSEDGFLIREIDSVKVQGKNEPVVLFESFDADPEDVKARKKALLEQHLTALYKFKARDFSDALRDFRELLNHSPDDRVARIYVERCENFMESPPPDDWRGVSQVWKQ